MANVSTKKVALSGMVGNILEWYDFTLYGYLAVILSKLFFPSDNEFASLLASFGAFAVGFFFRPLGSVILGYIGDKYGRKKALIISIFLMAFPTFFIGLLPTYNDIGVLAPILLIILRILQGISTGGEYTTSVSFVVEHSPAEKRGFYGSINLLGAVIGIMFGSLMEAFITSIFDKESLETFGWRIGFLFGIVLAFVGIYLRRKAEETPVFLAIEEENKTKNPLLKTFIHHPKEFLISIIYSSLQGVAFFLLFVYLPTFYQKVLKIEPSTALFINSFAMTVLILLIPVMAYLSDKVGRKLFLLVSTFLYSVSSVFLFKLILTGDITNIIVAHVLFAVISSGFMAILPTFLIETFPADVRNTAFSVGYNIALGIFGGTVPIVATYLISKTQNPLSPSFYLTAVAFAVFITTLFIKETKNKPLY
ncbi:MFS transporter [Sulfurihydrogenibium azorense]|uniref:MFS transporter n=2 Tax=Sulfurihydrogenibium azorense TaxID=309806 RepID=UPI0024093796|nr:MFS transporter [Sulfurihydrogenibium azorense]MDM7273236.1 MFS transporter [Sulfurihydrogenibium azorense]